eukprot:GHRR01016240.1.p1 GENE.GHRR01016240.1~~GHRR01016240.1.p1  ORF type:complete len:607 (+),score=179.00 GHRR01016240.1:807-2627(+)
MAGSLKEYKYPTLGDMTGGRRSDKGSEVDLMAIDQQEPPQLIQQGIGKGAGKGGKRLRAPGPLVADPTGPSTTAAAGLHDHAGPHHAMHHPLVPREQVVLPLELTTRVRCRWKDGEYYRAKVLERRIKPEYSGKANIDPFTAWEYYVHFSGLNRRMDQWVDTADFDLNTVELQIEEVGPDGKKRKKVEEPPSDDEDHGDFDPQQLKEHEEFTKVKNIDVIQLGMHEMDTWYFSPLPPEYKDCKKLYFCEYSLHFFKRRSQLMRHLSKCKLRHPPGDEIYRKDNVSMFEVDGRKEKQYCQNLCYLAKLFLDHKTLYYDVDLFLFYVLCETDARGAHIVSMPVQQQLVPHMTARPTYWPGYAVCACGNATMCAVRTPSCSPTPGSQPQQHFWQEAVQLAPLVLRYVVKNTKTAMQTKDGLCDNTDYARLTALNLHTVLVQDMLHTLFWQVGYFSKEKQSEDGYNLACILTLPCYQKKGYGKFLISFSYELSKLEGKVGTPERPLSDLGRVSYRSYWTRVLMPVLKEREGTISIKELSELTCIKPDDIIYTLQHLGLIQYQKGQHVLVAAAKLLDQHLREAGSWGLQVDPSKIIWTPYDATHEYASFKG